MRVVNSTNRLRGAVLRVVLAGLSGLVGFGQQLHAAEADLSAAADRLLATTVTLRVLPANEQAAAAPANVAVCSGISLGQGRVVTFVAAPQGARFRATLPDGGQADAAIRVVDQYSGLTLLELDQGNLPGLELAEEFPRIGEPILAAAASGIEKPVVSLGILGGIDRVLGGTGLPPVLQCDVRTTSTSSGAPVVDRRGRLIGVIAATGTPGERVGWTFAVPVSHVRRLQRAWVDGKTVVLRRQRPVLGLTLGAGEEEGAVRVERVVEGGPADRAGIRPGQRVTSVDGVKIRSVYQAYALVMKKQPGDRMEFGLSDGDAARRVAVTLGGGTAGAADNLPLGPMIVARRSADDSQRITLSRTPRVEELAADAADGSPPQRELARLRAELAAKDRRLAELEAQQRQRQQELAGLDLLQRQIAAFGQVISALQEQLRQRDQRQQETDLLVKSLTEEVNRLRQQLDGEKGGGTQKRPRESSAPATP